MVRMKDPLFEPRKRKAAPFPFVLEALAPLEPRTNVMFGCLAVYVGEKIVLILRDRPTGTADNGVWIATTIDHHGSLGGLCRRCGPSSSLSSVLGRRKRTGRYFPPTRRISRKRRCVLAR